MVSKHVHDAALRGILGTRPKTPRSPRRVFPAPALSRKTLFATSKPRLSAPSRNEKSLGDARSRFPTGPLELDGGVAPHRALRNYLRAVAAEPVAPEAPAPAPPPPRSRPAKGDEKE
jgi:hypothetical protein